MRRTPNTFGHGKDFLIGPRRRQPGLAHARRLTRPVSLCSTRINVMHLHIAIAMIAAAMRISGDNLLAGCEA